MEALIQGTVPAVIMVKPRIPKFQALVTLEVIAPGVCFMPGGIKQLAARGAGRGWNKSLTARCQGLPSSTWFSALLSRRASAPAAPNTGSAPLLCGPVTIPLTKASHVAAVPLQWPAPGSPRLRGGTGQSSGLRSSPRVGGMSGLCKPLFLVLRVRRDHGFIP